MEIRRLIQYEGTTNEPITNNLGPMERQYLLYKIDKSIGPTDNKTCKSVKKNGSDGKATFTVENRQIHRSHRYNKTCKSVKKKNWDRWKGNIYYKKMTNPSGPQIQQNVQVRENKKWQYLLYKIDKSIGPTDTTKRASP